MSLQQAFEVCQNNKAAWLQRKNELAAAEQEYLRLLSGEGRNVSRLDELRNICVFRSIRSRIGIEVRSAIRIHSINRELNFFYRFLTR
ncbi:phage polarity suppression protein, partial [Escherichia coli]|uniref:phage polarity suppression protein n=1 Tax=Escherichia coli TaxID=562 RepID=UPI003C6CE025